VDSLATERPHLGPTDFREVASFERFLALGRRPGDDVPAVWHPYCTGTGPAPPTPWSPEFTEVE
jgi:hypothetical protein